MTEPHRIEANDYALLARVFAGEASAAERAVVTQWMQSDPARQAMVERLCEIWGCAGTLQEDADAEMAFVAIQERFIQRRHMRPMADAARAERIGLSRVMPWGRRSLVGTAAAAAVVLAAGISWFAVREYRPRHQAPVLTALSARDVVTRRGEHATLDLVDGTRVILAPGSRLRIPTSYNATTGPGSRDLDLDGEGYFEVRHDVARPFRVRTALGIAEDIGTAFVVTSYPETHGMRVMVASGSVSMRRATIGHGATGPVPSQALSVLQHGDLGWLDSLGTMTVQHGVNVQRYLAWKSGHLVFDGTPLREVVPILMRWYDIEIRLGDASLAGYPIVATIDSESTQDVIRRLALSLNARAEWHGRIVTFHTW